MKSIRTIRDGMAKHEALANEVFVLAGPTHYVAASWDGSTVRHLGEVRATEEEALSDAQEALEHVAT